MDIENQRIESQIVEELDVFIRVPKLDLYMMQYPLKAQEVGFTQYETIQSIKARPQQKKIKMQVGVATECENFPSTKGGRSYELESKLINHRTNYCIGKIENGKLILIPVAQNVQMRKSFADLENRFKDPKAIKAVAVENPEDLKGGLQEVNSLMRKKENLKQIDRKLRSYPFQKEILDSEEEIQLKYYGKDEIESRKLVHSLLDPPLEFRKVKTLPKNQYIKYLF